MPQVLSGVLLIGTNDTSLVSWFFLLLFFLIVICHISIFLKIIFTNYIYSLSSYSYFNQSEGY